MENCFDQSNFRTIDSITINGACLVRKVFTCKSQIPDSFPFVIEREFGPEAAGKYEEYVSGRMRSNDQIVTI